MCVSVNKYICILNHTLTEIVSDSLLQSVMGIRRVLLNGPQEVSEGITATRMFACICTVDCTRTCVKMVEINLQSPVTMLMLYEPVLNVRFYHSLKYRCTDIETVPN